MVTEVDLEVYDVDVVEDVAEETLDGEVVPTLELVVVSPFFVPFLAFALC